MRVFSLMLAMLLSLAANPSLATDFVYDCSFDRVSNGHFFFKETQISYSDNTLIDLAAVQRTGSYEFITGSSAYLGTSREGPFRTNKAIIYDRANSFARILIFNSSVISSVIDISPTTARVMDLGGIPSYGDGKCTLRQGRMGPYILEKFD